MATFPTEYYYNSLASKTKLLNSIHFNDVRNHILKVTVNYNKYGYTMINEVPSTLLVDLMGNTLS